MVSIVNNTVNYDKILEHYISTNLQNLKMRNLMRFFSHAMFLHEKYKIYTITDLKSDC